MRTGSFRFVLIGILVASLGLLACDLSTITSLGLGSASKPQVTIQSPTAGASFIEGDSVTVQSTATDSKGIVRVELSVDGAVVRTDAPPVPQGQTSFSVIQTWTATAGNHTLSVRAYNASGGASDPALVAVTIAPSQAAAPTAEATLMPLGETPVNPAIQLTPTLSPSGDTPVAPGPTRTRAPSPTPTINAPPGVYATSIRLDPAKPGRNENVTFYVTFLNTTGTQQGFRWRIRIFKNDGSKNSFGDTAPLNNTINVGSSELASDNGWAARGPVGCLDLVARVYSVDPSTKQESEFHKPGLDAGPTTEFHAGDCP